MIRYILHTLKIAVTGLALAYLATHYLLEPMSDMAKSISLGIVLAVILFELFGNRFRSLSR